MKAAINGALNVSILDGWWCEAYSDERGWYIGNGDEYADPAYQDAVESQALYNVLENEIIPCFYEVPEGKLSNRWLHMMKASMKMAMEEFCSLRMLNDYEQQFYIPIIHRLKALLKDHSQEARDLAARVNRLYSLWKEIAIGLPVQSSKGPFRTGNFFEATVDICLGELNPEEVFVELYNGQMKSADTLQGIGMIPMTVVEKLDSKTYRYQCQVPCQMSGRFGFTVRVTPEGDGHLKHLPGLIAWS
jgi:starch phosphorylase